MSIDYKLNEINDQQDGLNNTQGWNSMPSHDIMVPVPIKMQPSLGMLDPNNHQINNSSPHPSVIHTSPQTPHVSWKQTNFDIPILLILNMFIFILRACQ